MSDEKVTKLDGDEIDNMMLEDKTTEETVESTEEQLDQEALEATKDEKSDEETETTVETTEEEQTTEEEKVDPKDAKIGEFRRKNRDLELENAKLQGKLEAQESMSVATKTAEVVKSPLELAEEAYIEEYGPVPPEGVPMTSKLYSEQRAFDAKQDEKPAEETGSRVDPATEIAFDFLQEGDLSVEKAGKGKDLKSVLTQAAEVLTDGELLDLKNFGSKNTATATLRQTYNKTVARLKESGTWKEAKKVVTKEAQDKERKLKSNDIDDLMTKEDDNYTADSENDDSSKLAGFIVNATGG